MMILSAPQKTFPAFHMIILSFMLGALFPSSHSTNPPTIDKTISQVPYSIIRANDYTLVEMKKIEFGDWNIVTALKWSRNGDYLAIAAGNQIFIYESRNWDQIATIRLKCLSRGLAFSPDDDWIVVGSNDGFIRVWELEEILSSHNDDYLPLFEFEAHENGVNNIHFNREGNWFATSGNEAMVRIWKVQNLEIANEIIGGTYAIPSLAIFPSDQEIAIVNGNFIRLRDVETSSISGTFKSETAFFSVAINPNGDVLAVGDQENLIRLWDPNESFRTGQESYPEGISLFGHNGKESTYQGLIWQIRFSPNSTLLASAGGDGTIRLWNSIDGSLLYTQNAHTSGTTSIEFHPKENIIASGGLDGSVKLWLFE